MEEVEEVETYQLQATSNFGNDIPDTTPCSRCGDPVGFDVDQCVVCGTPNRWVHPDIQLFRDNVDAIQWGEREDVRWSSTRTSIFVSALIPTVGSRISRLAYTSCILGMILVVFQPLMGSLMLFVSVICIIVNVFFTDSNPDQGELSVSYESGTPIVRCSDSEFFEPVLSLLELQAPRQRRI